MEVFMAEKEFADASAERGRENVPARCKKKTSRSLWILFLVFFAFVASVFLFQHKGTINWVEDYAVGIELAKEQDKPVLLAFYKLHSRFCSDMSQNTYNNPEVIKYVEANFVPVLIDVDKQPEIARRYNINYYPTHYIKHPRSDAIVGPHIGYDMPAAFIRKLEDLLKKMNLPDK